MRPLILRFSSLTHTQHAHAGTEKNREKNRYTIEKEIEEIYTSCAVNSSATKVN